MTAERVKGMVKIRDVTNELIQCQMEEGRAHGCADFRAEEPVVEHGDDQDDDGADDECRHALIEAGELPDGEDRVLLQKRQVCLAHDAQVDGVERDHRQDAGEQGRYPELRAEDARDDAAEHAGDAGREDRGDGVIAGRQQGGGRGGSEREAALDGQVRDVEHAEGQVDADGEQCPEQSL